MKKIQILILSIFISCSIANEIRNDVSYDDKELIPFQSNTKWGFVDTEKNILIKSMYDSVGFFYNGIAKVKVGGNYGLIRNDNSYLIKPRYQKVGEFYNNFSRITINGESNYIDSNGDFLENTPLLSGYCGGVITTMYKGVTTKIDENYELVFEKLKRIDSKIVMIYDTTNLQADTIIDYSHEYIQVVKNGRIGIIKFNQENPSKTIVKHEDLKYDSVVIANYYSGSINYSRVKVRGLWGIINAQGYGIVKPIYLSILNEPNEIRTPIAVTSNVFYKYHKKLLVEYKENKFGYIDIEGKEYFKR
ncbi:MAG: WG repeat-containing protein [Saprospiraceae bacterium]